MRSVYVSADGIVYPCCWIGNQQWMAAYRALHGDRFERLDLNRRSLEEILADPQFAAVERSWTSASPFAGCQWFCGRPHDRAHTETDGTSWSVDIHLTNTLPKRHD